MDAETVVHKMPEAVRLRLLALYQQRLALNQRYDELIFVALEAMGAKEGAVLSVNLDTGEIVVRPDPDIEVGD